MVQSDLSDKVISTLLEGLLNDEIQDLRSSPLSKTNLVYLANTKKHGKVVIKIIFRPPVVPGGMET